MLSSVWILASLTVAEGVLWRAPASHAVERFVKPDSAEAPQAPFRYLKEETAGTTPKVWVKDGRNRTWLVKWGREVHADVFASNLLRTLGYITAPTWYVGLGRIDGARSVQRPGADIDKNGNFRSARFRLIEDGVDYRSGAWRWDSNPFLQSIEGRLQLNGLKLVMLLLSNWDAKDARQGKSGNTAIFVRNGVPEYAVDDWGAALGGWGGFFSRDKWDCDEFRAQDAEFVRGIDDRGMLDFGYSGKHKSDISVAITPQDVHWLMEYLDRLSKDHLATALRASGAPEREANCFATSIRHRIDRLKQVAASR